MRPVSLGRPNRPNDFDAFRRWALDALAEVERASQEDLAAIAKDFTVSNFTATRTLNAGTATTTDIANVLCTFIKDLQSRGMKRSQ